MKIHLIRMSVLTAALAVCASCMKEQGMDAPVVEYDRVVLSVDPFNFEDDVVTKLTPIISSTGVDYIWAQGDTVGIYPDAGSQLVFPVADYGAKTTSFDGGAWRLSSDHIYYAYVPFVPDIRLDKGAVPVSFLGQKQHANADATGLRDYVFMSAAGTAPAGRDLIFQFKRLGCLIFMEFDVRQYDAFSSLRVSLMDGTPLPVGGKFDLAATTDTAAPDLTDIVTAKSWDLSLDYIGGENGKLTCYMMAPPVDLTGKTVKFELVSGAGKTVYTAAGKNLRKSGATKFTPSKMEGIIDFRDPLVHDKCVNSRLGWDTNGNGELEYTEAAAVTEIPDGMFANSQIKSFDELQYFTSLERIGEWAFDSCRDLESLTFPEGNTLSIGEGAFYQCCHNNGINSQRLRINHIGQEAFEDSGFACDVELTDDVTEIPQFAFYDSWIKPLNIPQGVRIIGEGAFAYNRMTGDIVLPESLESLGKGAFMGTKITGITLPSSLTKIADNMFYYCDDLASVVIPNGVVSLGMNCFMYCPKLQTVSLPESLLDIGENCFHNCEALESIVIPSKVTEIKSGTFHYCHRLTDVTLPEGLVTIADPKAVKGPFDEMIAGDGAFTYCTLGSISFPSTLSFIGEEAFSNCKYLTSVIIPDNVRHLGAKAFQNCTRLSECTLSENLSVLEDYVFRNTAIASLSIPASVKVIRSAFRNGNTELYMDSAVPATLSSADVLSRVTTIYVPDSAVGTYMAAPFWSEHADKIQSLPGGGAGGDTGGSDNWN